MKALGGGGGSHSRTSQKYVPKAQPKKSGPKKLSHKELLMLWTRQGGKFAPKTKVWTKQDIDRARNAKQEAAGKDAQAAGAAGQEGEEEPDEDFKVLATDLARARMQGLAQQLSASVTDAASGGEGPEEVDLEAVAEARRLQLEELEMVEAMFVEEFLLVSDAAGVEALRARLAEAPGDAGALRAAAEHPPLEFALQLTAKDQRAAGDTEGRELIASILLRVSFPASYPSTAPLELVIEDAMIADANEEMGLDRVLYSLMDLDAAKLTAEMLRQAAEIQPAPVVYELATWLCENAFMYLEK